jgi:hypothetical protein
MKVVFADSEELVNEDASADRVLDGRIDSYWHTQWNREDAPHPHQLVLDLGEEQVISGIQYIPRRDRINGRGNDRGRFWGLAMTEPGWAAFASISTRVPSNPSPV